jgi:hypothetical protein
LDFFFYQCEDFNLSHRSVVFFFTRSILFEPVHPPLAISNAIDVPSSIFNGQQSDKDKQQKGIERDIRKERKK